MHLEGTLSHTTGQSQEAKGAEKTSPAPCVHPKKLSDHANHGLSSPKR